MPHVVGGVASDLMDIDLHVLGIALEEIVLALTPVLIGWPRYQHEMHILPVPSGHGEADVESTGTWYLVGEIESGSSNSRI